MPQPHFAIETPNLRRLLQSARCRRWALALALPFAGIVTAFGIAPGTLTDTLKRTRVVEPLDLPLQTALSEASRAQAAQAYWREERIQRGDTLARLFARLQLDDAQAIAFLNTAPGARALLQLIPEHSLRVQSTSDGRLLTLYYLNGERMLTVRREGNTFSAEDKVAALETRVMFVAGVIGSSLFGATDAMEVPEAITMQLVEAFSTDIDFHRDLRRNDRFSMVYEEQHDQGAPVRAGRLLSAEFVNQGRRLSAIWFQEKGSEGAYYTFAGKNVRKAFLRSPLEFSRISSAFTIARYHPILHTWRAHTGVDYVAPIGARIRATADGVIEFAGAQPGYGNVVILRHQDKYTTLYAHMQGVTPGIRRGLRVQQGDVIGAVGMSGLTTGPHLHYEFRVNGVHQDPLSVAVPVAYPIAPEHRLKFQQAALPLAQAMIALRGG